MKRTRIEKWRERMQPTQNELMRRAGAIARKKGLPCIIRPYEVRRG